MIWKDKCGQLWHETSKGHWLFLVASGHTVGIFKRKGMHRLVHILSFCFSENWVVRDARSRTAHPELSSEV